MGGGRCLDCLLFAQALPFPVPNIAVSPAADR